MTDQTYHGWADWTTWNCALWIQNDQWLYDIAKECVDYKEFLQEVLYMVGMENDATQDGADWGEANLDEMNELIAEIQETPHDWAVRTFRGIRIRYNYLKYGNAFH